MLKSYRRRAVIVAVLLALAAPGTLASVVLTGTRLIYTELDQEVTIKLTNEGATPSLVQAWTTMAT
ncbi:fimbria/pilus periplasmic chaperone [Cupriavidus pauculus]|uniref:fimbria/pilus periplasmic chaperone n=1 Tax=Cupriavidus pauculus TaxID=82633 RepID=UPI0021557901|nr:fimbria/pilus periplasmic chaperone [Cupriavidus pauculus]